MEKWIKTDFETPEISHVETLCLARERIIRKGKKMAERYDENRVFTEFKEGDEVLVKDNNVSNSDLHQIAKFFAVYEGPYIVKRKVGDATYLFVGEKEKERGRFHISNLKPYKRVVTTITEDKGLPGKHPRGEAKM